jgi:hypothetical protein
MYRTFLLQAGPGAPNVWLEAGIHAREWIAPAVATFIMRELVWTKKSQENGHLKRKHSIRGTLLG